MIEGKTFIQVRCRKFYTENFRILTFGWEKEEINMAWFYLAVAGLFECGWAIGLKYTEGFTKLVPSILTASAMAMSVWLLSVAMKAIPVGTAYAVWTGIGAVGVVIMGMILFGESRDIMRVICLLLIVSGIVGLKLFSSSQG
ncbi:MAG: quaternary ammonium compound efflux SMR transporter SugE [Spirochaetales bacterium]|jgi:quaternary ammonium compound-resistance protein SugE|nr:quaternary ammonium compound efflux SMR transporter SugE [Spirochaetales bacterium]